MTSGAQQYRPPVERKMCVDCLQWYYSWGAHAERCPGPRQRIAPAPARDGGHECGCNTGGMHEPDCVWVTGEARS